MTQTATTPNPYGELPYCAYPIVWTAPERLALASLLHGGPRLPLDQYRVLELGCADGANLLPMAWYRRHGDFTGLDASARQIGLANASRDKLGLANLRFVHGDFRTAKAQLDGPYDIIMAHGVFSWVDDASRDAMLEMCVELLAPAGLLYDMALGVGPNHMIDMTAYSTKMNSISAFRTEFFGGGTKV